MNWKSQLLKFPFLSLQPDASVTIIPKLALAAAILKPSSLILPSGLIDNFYKSMVALATHPMGTGDRVKIDKHDGVVKNISFWYLTLERPKGYVFIPTSHVYNTVIETFR